MRHRATLSPDVSSSDHARAVVPLFHWDDEFSELEPPAEFALAIVAERNGLSVARDVANSRREVRHGIHRWVISR